MTTAEAPAEEYNGWANRETWAVNLWLSNDQGSDTEARALAKEAVAAYETRCQEMDFEANETGRQNSAGAALREFVAELLDPTDSPLDPETRWSMTSDCGSTWRVDWREIGAAFLEES